MQNMPQNFTSHGYEVWITDYPGYGKTTGKLTEENLYMQAKEVYKLANSKFGKDNIIVYGKSLGSGIASYLASKKPAGGLSWKHLITAFPICSAAMRRFILLMLWRILNSHRRIS